jgi:hypothetical protein
MSERSPHTESELIELVRSIDVRAPEHLHARIEAMVAERAGERKRAPRPFRLGFAAALPALGVLALLLVLVLSGGSSPRLTLEETVALTLRPATMPAPAENPRNGAQLQAKVDGVAFPYWEESFGWRSTGAHTDRLDGRTVTTVDYAGTHGQWIGYAIVAGTPAPQVAGGTIMRRGGTPYRFLISHGAQVVTWLRDGRLCVVAGHGVTTATLLSLASWHGQGTMAS